MILMRSGMVLFATVTAMAALILWGLVYWGGLVTPDWRPRFITDLVPVLLLCVVTIPMSILVTILAWRGRRQPVSDGASIAAGVVVAACVLLTLVPGESSEFGRGFDTMAKAAYCGFGLASVVPAYLITYFALRRTPLLRGLAPDRTELKTWLDQRL